MQRASLQLITTDPSLDCPALEAAIQLLNADARRIAYAQAVREGNPPTADVNVILTSDRAKLATLDPLLRRLAARPRGTLLLVNDPEVDLETYRRRLHAPAGLPLTIARGEDAAELATRLRTLVELRASLDTMHARQLASRRITTEPSPYLDQLQRAERLQREFLPAKLPEVDGVTFAALYQPADFVSGDIYDVRRLDNDHIALVLADAEGHGMHAALLSVFIKRALLARLSVETTADCWDPAGVLAEINDELIEADFSECHFVAAVYALLNTRTRELTLARAGAPHPILRRAGGNARMIRAAGSLLGVLPGAAYENIRLPLEAGDTLLLYSDGLEEAVGNACHTCDVAWCASSAALASRQSADRYAGAQPPASVAVGAKLALRTSAGGPSSFISEEPAFDGFGNPAPFEEGWALTCPEATEADNDSPSHHQAAAPADEQLCETAWFRRLADEGVDAALEQVVQRRTTLRRLGRQVDDLTALTIRYGG